MSTSGFTSGGISQLESVVSGAEQFLKDFQQLGTDLKAGNTNAAQQDFVTLSQDAQSASSNTVNNAADSSTINHIEAGFQSLSQSLQAGNLSAAQTAYSQIVQATVSQSSSAQTTQNGDDFGTFLQLLHQLVAGTASSSAGSTSTVASSSAASTSSSSTSSATDTSGTGVVVKGLTVPRLGAYPPSHAKESKQEIEAQEEKRKTSSAQSAASDSTSEESNLGQPPQLGYGTVGALAAMLKDLGDTLGKGNLSGAQNTFASFVQQAQSGSSKGVIGGAWVQSLLGAQGTGGTESAQVNLNA